MSAPSHAAAQTPPAHYVRVWAVLAALLVVSVAGPTLGIRTVTLITAFGVALVKAYLVARNFMHLNVERPFVHWALGIALIFMVLLYAGVAPDVQKSRGERWRKSAGFHYVAPRAQGTAGTGEESHAVTR